MTPPVLVYLGMGLIIARIQLDGTKTRGFTWLQWMQFLIDAARIVFLWPLVLFIEKLVEWLKTAEPETPVSTAVLQSPSTDPDLEHVQSVKGEAQ